MYVNLNTFVCEFFFFFFANVLKFNEIYKRPHKVQDIVNLFYYIYIIFFLLYVFNVNIT